MKLFKNGVGRPSNEILQKRKRFYIIITFLFICGICSIGLSYKYFSNSINVKEKNATTSNCVIPYTTSNCKYARNETVKQIQKMLNKLGFYKESYGYDGNFGPKTVTAVKDFQKSQGVGVDGSVGPDTLERLAKATNTQYYKIKYNKNGGTGSLKSNTQIILHGVPTKINNIKLTKANSTHVGYTATTKIGVTEVRYGCLGKTCSGNYRIYTLAQIKGLGKPLQEYVYEIGEEFLSGVWPTGQEITFTAKYCNKNEKYNNKTKKCETNSNNSSNNDSNNNSSSSSNNTAKEEFKQISNFDIQELSSKIGTQTIVNGVGRCFSSAMAYGVYMLSDGQKIASKTSTAWASYSWNGYNVERQLYKNDAISMWNYIKTKIDSEIPLVIHTKSEVEHYVTIYAYNSGYTPTSNEDWEGIAKNIKIIDPFYSYSHYNNYSVTLKHGIAYENKLAYPFYGDGRILSWTK